jgi:hypothetical protein
VAQDDRVSVTVGQTVTVDVTANDLGATPDRIAIIAGTEPAKGLAKVVGLSIEYTSEQPGTDSFSYESINAAGKTQAKVFIISTELAGDTLAALTANPELKPVASAMGESCKLTVLSGKSISPEQADLVSQCHALIVGKSGIDNILEAIRNEEVLAVGDAVQEHDTAIKGNLLSRLDAVRGGKSRGFTASQFAMQIGDVTLAGDFNFAENKISPYLGIAYGRAFIAADRKITSRFAAFGTVGQSFAVNSDVAEKNQGSIQFGFTAVEQDSYKCNIRSFSVVHKQQIGRNCHSGRTCISFLGTEDLRVRGKGTGAAHFFQRW